LLYTKYEPLKHRFIGLVIYLKAQKRWICTVQAPDQLEGIVVDFYKPPNGEDQT
jgi:hypothetical protein